MPDTTNQSVPEGSSVSAFCVVKSEKHEEKIKPVLQFWRVTRFSKFSRQQDPKITFEFEMNASDFEEIIIPIYHTKVTPEIWLFEVILILIIVIGMCFSELVSLFFIKLRDNYLFFTLASCVKRKRKKAVSDRRNQLRIL